MCLLGYECTHIKIAAYVQRKDCRVHNALFHKFSSSSPFAVFLIVNVMCGRTLASMSAPFVNSKVAASDWPLWAAQCKGVLPLISWRKGAGEEEGG